MKRQPTQVSVATTIETKDTTQTSVRKRSATQPTVRSITTADTGAVVDLTVNTDEVAILGEN